MCMWVYTHTHTNGLATHTVDWYVSNYGPRAVPLGNDGLNRVSYWKAADRQNKARHI